MSEQRSIPLLGDISLEFVQRIEHSLDAGFSATRIAALPGELQQRSGRPSHRVAITGVLHGDAAGDALGKLQKAAQTGEELTFAADITNALELQKVVLTSFRAVETAGRPRRFDYHFTLAESPPLPPPAELEPFGGLGDFGLGDLGFDTGLLDDITGEMEDLAGEVANAVEGALDVVNQLGSLANLDGLNLGGFLEPMNNVTKSVGDIGGSFKGATDDLLSVFNK